jgi:WD40 repeat protein
LRCRLVLGAAAFSTSNNFSYRTLDDPQHPTPNAPPVGSLDRTVRLWDLKQGMPVSASRPAGGTVRAVALDDAALFSGGGDHLIRLWESSSVNGSSSGGGGSSGGGRRGVRGRGDADVDDLLLPDDDDEEEDGGGEGDDDDDADAAPLFDLAGRERLLTGHIGPITSFSLTGPALYSGSWDTCVRVWQRSEE